MCRSVIGAAYEPLGIAIERCAVIGAPQCSTVAALGPIRERDVGTISGRHLPMHYGNPMLRLQRAYAVGAAGGRPLLPSLAGRVRPQSRRERGRGAPGTTGGQHPRAGASPAPVGRPRPTMDGGATPAGGRGDVSGPRMLPLLLPLNSAIPRGRGRRSGYAYPCELHIRTPWFVVILSFSGFQGGARVRIPLGAPPELDPVRWTTPHDSLATGLG
jgi:hypothetical protein